MISRRWDILDFQRTNTEHRMSWAAEAQVFGMLGSPARGRALKARSGKRLHWRIHGPAAVGKTPCARPNLALDAGHALHRLLDEPLHSLVAVLVIAREVLLAHTETTAQTPWAADGKHP